MKIAVIGAGIFGATAAIKLSEAGFEVDLYEKEPDILQAASGINQYRLHRGYHYPRSADTAISSKLAESSFREEYGEAIIDNNEHYYCIARKGSQVSGEEFRKFLLACELGHEEAELEYVPNHMVELTVKGKESLIDPIKLREIVRKRIAERDINLFLNRVFVEEDLENYDLVVNAAYANLNSILSKYPEAKREYQFEVCEKLVLRLPEKFRRKSVVVLDGPFFCIDPYGNTDFHVMGNVVHAIHATNTGLFPLIPENIKPLMNRGIIKNPAITNLDKFLEVAAQFIPEIRQAEHVGSMYTVRAVLPNVEATDARPTLVHEVNDKIINIFSGKLGNCVKAAEEVLRLIKQKVEARVAASP